MVSNYRHNGIGEINRREYVRANTCMKLHFIEFSCRQFPWLVQNVFGHCKFAHVMEQRGRFDGFNELLVSYTDYTGETDCVRLNSSYVTVCNLILSVNRHC